MPPEPHGGDRDFCLQFLERLEAELGASKYQQWFSQKVRILRTDEELTLVCGSSYLAGWLQRQFRTVVGRILEELAPGLAARWTYDESTVSSTTVGGANSTTLPSVARTTRELDTSVTGRNQSVRRIRDLATFVRGRSNLLAWGAVERILSTTANSLYLYCGVGNGKTHLLEGIAQQMRRENPRRQVLSLSAEAFANYFTQALDARTTASFRQRFRNIDVLVMDDVDFLDGKKGLQEEFLNTLRRIESRGGQVIVAADRHPNLLTRTSSEILSRFTSGLVCRIDSPDPETRRQIVLALRESLEFSMSDEAVSYVASRFQDNVRELEGAMNTLLNWSIVTRRPVTLTSAKEALGRLERDCLRVVKLSDVENVVCQTFGLSTEELRSDKRTRAASQPRMLAMYLARRLTGTAYSEIGQFFGGRNHSTVLSAERRINELVRSRTSVRIGGGEWTVQELVESLERQILVG